MLSAQREMATTRDDTGVPVCARCGARRGVKMEMTEVVEEPGLYNSVPAQTGRPG